MKKNLKRRLAAWQRLLVWFMCLNMTVMSVPVWALPSGEQVVHGEVQFRKDGKHLLVTQGSQVAIVNYDAFGIFNDETVQFNQPDVSSRILNRVTGGSRSEIAGALLANGQVYIVNPNGILFTRTANVNVGGLVASAFNMTDDDFLNGRMLFQGGGGSVINDGSIRAADAVYLVGREVRNAGHISSPRLILAEGETSVEIDEIAGGRVRLIIDGVEQKSGQSSSGSQYRAKTTDDVQRTNGISEVSATIAEEDDDAELASLPAEQDLELPSGASVQSGQASVSKDGDTLTVNQVSERAIMEYLTFNIGQDATVRFIQPGASSAILNRILGGDGSRIAGMLIANGRVYIVNPNGIVFTSTSRVNVGGLVATTSDIDNDLFMEGLDRYTEGIIEPATGTPGADGNESETGPSAAGQALAAAIIQAGQITASESDGASIYLEADTIDHTGLSQALNDDGMGGSIEMNARDTLWVNEGSTIRAGGQDALQGGDIQLLGERVGIEDARVDASGQFGGGEIFIGGDFGGEGSVPLASATYIGPDAQIRADALVNGDGGNIAVWGADVMQFHGEISARGGEEGGNGGFVEVSGLGHIDVAGTVDTRAPQGEAGTFLIDPTDLEIGNFADSNVSGVSPFEPTGSPSQLSWLTLTNNLALGNVLVRTTLGFDAGQDGDITVVDGVVYDSANALDLEAAGSIIINGSVENQGAGLLGLRADNSISQTAPISVQNLLAIAGGSIELDHAGNEILAVAAESVDDLSIRTTTDLSVNTQSSPFGPITRSGLASTLGNITVVAGGALDISQGVSASAGAGDVELDATTTITSSGSGLVTSDTLTADAVTGIDLNTAVATLDASVSGTGAILIDETDAINLSDVDTADGSITVDAGGQITATDVASGGTAGEDIALTSTGAGIEVVSVNAGAADVTLDAQGGSITQSSGKITANELLVTASGSVGAGGAPMLTDVDAVAVEAGGNVYVQEDNVLTITTIGATSGIRAGGNAKVQAGGTLTVAQEVNAGQDVMLRSVVGGVSQNASVSSTNGSISVLASGSIGQNAAITVQSGTGSIDVESSAGGVTMASGTVTSSDGGNIRYAANGDVALGLLNAGAGDVSVVSATGNILEATAGNNIAADYLRLEAAGGIGASGAGNALDTAVTTLASKSGAAGTYILEADGLTLDDTGSGSITVTRIALDSTTTPVTDAALARSGESDGVYKVETTGGTIVVAAASVSDAVLAAGDILIRAGGAGSDLTQNAGADIVSSGGDISLLAQDAIAQDAAVTSSGGTIDVEAFDGALTMASGTITGSGGGNIRYAANGDVALGLLNAGAGDVSVVSATASITDARADTVDHDAQGFATQTGDPRTVNIIASAARLQAGQDIGAAGNPLDTHVGTLAAASTVGSTYIYEDDALEIGTVGPVSVTRTHLDSTTTPVTDAALSGVTAGGHAKVETITGTLTVDQPVQAGMDVLLAAGASSSDLVTDESVSSGGNATLLAGQDVLVDGTVTSTADDIWIWAGRNAEINSDLTSGGLGNIGVRAVGNVLLGAMTASTGNGGILMDAGGDLIDDLATVIQTSGRTVLRAGNDVNMQGSIESGDLYAYAGGDLNLGVTVVTNLLWLGTAGDLNSATPLSAQTVGLFAGGDIGAAGDSVQIDAPNLAAQSTGGNIFLHTLQNVSLIPLNAGAGLVVLEQVALDSTTETVEGSVSPVPLNGIQSAGNADLDAEASVGGNQVVAGGNIDLDAPGQSVSVNEFEAGGFLDIFSGTLSADTLESGGETIIDTGSMEIRNGTSGGNMNIASSSLSADTLEARSNIDIVTGDMDVSSIQAGNRIQSTSGNLRFNNMDAQTIDARAGSIAMGRVNAGQAQFDARGNITDNNSLLNVNTLRMTASGNIGGQGAPIRMNTRTIQDIRGNNVFINEQSSGIINLGLISANGFLSLSAPNIGGGNGTGGFVDANGNAINLRAGAGALINVAGFLGQPDNPLETDFQGPVDLDSHGLSGLVTPGGYVYVIVNQEGDLPFPFMQYIGMQNVPGLIIANGRVIGGDAELLRRIFRTEAFAMETPELKSQQGVFGEPYFVHEFLDVSDPVALGLIDFILAQDAIIIGHPELPIEAQREISVGGVHPSTAYNFMSSEQPFLPPEPSQQSDETPDISEPEGMREDAVPENDDEQSEEEPSNDGAANDTGNTLGPESKDLSRKTVETDIEEESESTSKEDVDQSTDGDESEE